MLGILEPVKVTYAADDLTLPKQVIDARNARAATLRVGIRNGLRSVTVDHADAISHWAKTELGSANPDTVDSYSKLQAYWSFVNRVVQLQGTLGLLRS